VYLSDSNSVLVICHPMSVNGHAKATEDLTGRLMIRNDTGGSLIVGLDGAQYRVYAEGATLPLRPGSYTVRTAAPCGALTEEVAITADSPFGRRYSCEAMGKLVASGGKLTPTAVPPPAPRKSRGRKPESCATAWTLPMRLLPLRSKKSPLPAAKRIRLLLSGMPRPVPPPRRSLARPVAGFPPQDPRYITACGQMDPTAGPRMTD